VTTLPLSGSTIVAAADEILVSDFGDELVLLNLRDGVYYGLDGPGARVWMLLKRPITLKAIQDALIAEYDVEAARCAKDVKSLLTDLVARGLAEVQERR
jgi:Coenzyme PQQ synthesis protein D (PqqD)